MKRIERVEVFVRCIADWYAENKRKLPWRDLIIADEAERAYRILVSEIMLQQTQVNRVKIVFKDFLERFPKLSDLASASNTDVIMAWRGMGYNSRALRLRDAAKYIIDRDALCVMRDMKELQRIPGVGHYTAAAIRNFAFNIPTPCLDTNIRRILHRTFVGPENADGTWKKDDQYLLKLAGELLSTIHNPLSAADWHAALMDYGSLVCTKRNPKWEICPLTKAGIMKAAFKNPVPISQSQVPKTEPGRMVAGKYIPNRIFRGKVVEELRDAKHGLTPAELGRHVCIDWDPEEHTEWLLGVIQGLKRDQLVRVSKGKLLLT